MTAQEWTCPHCDRSQIATSENRDTNTNYLALGLKEKIGSRVFAQRCLNPACGMVTADVWIGRWISPGGNGISRPDFTAPPLFWRRVVPEGAAKPMPEFVPKAIRDDYAEACLIRDLSPKASATLARRCLQGMIRDFAKVSVKSKRLVNEIEALEEAVENGTAPRGVSIDSIEALTAVRKVGNIGAHMEADIDVIVDVDPGEAQILINLIESLIADWYVERHKRSARFASAVALAADKKAQIESAKVAALPAPEDGTG